MDIGFILVLLALGAIVGFMAGLLGIGGGGIMVPMLTSIFAWQGFPADTLIHLALGTSMASIVVTSFSSMRAHHRQQGVLWHVVLAMAPGIFIGALLTTYWVSLLQGVFLAGIFSAFMLGVAIQMVWGSQPKPHRNLPGKVALGATGSGIGGISALVSIGGGTLSVPFLYWHNIDMKKAIGTSAALGFPIAVSGTVGYLVHGWEINHSDSLTIGFIYWPAVFIISIMSIFFAPLGVKLAYHIPMKTIKKIFALLLFALSAKMFLSIVSS